MLLNKHGTDVTKSTDKFLKGKSKGTREAVLSQLRELHIPNEEYPKGMFSIEERAHMK